MTDIVTPPAIDALPPAPLPTDTPENFNTKAFATLAAQVALVTQVNAASAATNQNAVAAQERAVAAASSESTATTAATTATTKASEATTAASAAQTARTAAEAALDSFDDRYLGPKASDPAVDNDGAVLLAGALYYRTSAPAGMRVYTGVAWEAAYLPANSYLNTDFSSLTLDASIDGTEVVALSGGFRATLQSVLDWILARANSWIGVQYFRGLRETMVTANTSTAYTINATNGTIFDLTLTGNCTYTFPAATSGNQFTILQRQDATGSRTVAWPASVRWAGGTAPTITATASRTDVISFVADGTYWLGFVGGLNYTRA